MDQEAERYAGVIVPYRSSAEARCCLQRCDSRNRQECGTGLFYSADDTKVVATEGSALYLRQAGESVCRRRNPTTFGSRSPGEGIRYMASTRSGESGVHAVFRNQRKEQVAPCMGRQVVERVTSVTSQNQLRRPTHPAPPCAARDDLLENRRIPSLPPPFPLPGPVQDDWTSLAWPDPRLACTPIWTCFGTTPVAGHNVLRSSKIPNARMQSPCPRVLRRCSLPDGRRIGCPLVDQGFSFDTHGPWSHIELAEKPPGALDRHPLSWPGSLSVIEKVYSAEREAGRSIKSKPSLTQQANGEDQDVGKVAWKTREPLACIPDSTSVHVEGRGGFEGSTASGSRVLERGCSIVRSLSLRPSAADPHECAATVASADRSTQLTPRLGDAIRRIVVSRVGCDSTSKGLVRSGTLVGRGEDVVDNGVRDEGHPYGHCGTGSWRLSSTHCDRQQSCILLLTQMGRKCFDGVAAGDSQAFRAVRAPQVGDSRRPVDRISRKRDRRRSLQESLVGGLSTGSLSQYIKAWQDVSYFCATESVPLDEWAALHFICGGSVGERRAAASRMSKIRYLFDLLLLPWDETVVPRAMVTRVVDAVVKLANEETASGKTVGDQQMTRRRRDPFMITHLYRFGVSLERQRMLSVTRVQELVMLALMLVRCMRPMEITVLNISDLSVNSSFSSSSQEGGFVLRYLRGKKDRAWRQWKLHGHLTDKAPLRELAGFLMRGLQWIRAQLGFPRPFTPADSTTPLFSFGGIRGRRWTARQVSDLVLRIGLSIGEPYLRGHSLRSGGVALFKMAGYSDSRAMQQGDWASLSAFLNYARNFIRSTDTEMQQTCSWLNNFPFHSFRW